MAKITLQGNEIETVGNLLSLESKAPDFVLVKNDLSEVKLTDYQGKNIVLNIFPSLDTGVCAASVRRFNQEASNLENTVVLCISADLPFAQSRFCGAEGIENVITLSTFRNKDFGSDFGVEIKTGPLKGLMSRAIIILDKDGVVKYTEQVPEIAQEPDYDRALSIL